MVFVIIGAVAFLVSGLTLFTGFGLGTLLLPIFALFFPVTVAVAATAVVHGANSLFKFLLLRSEAHWPVVLRFGLPAVAAAFGGAILLEVLAGYEPLFTWQTGGLTGVVTPLKLVMGILIFVFSLFDLVPALQRMRVGRRWLPVGGLLSGFFGGLSGHQGALRAAFLGRLDLTPPQFAATQAVIAFLVDTCRLSVYGIGFFQGRMAGVETRYEWSIVGVAVVCAFAGAFLAKRLLSKVTIGALRILTGSLLIIVALGLACGLI